MHFTQRIIIAAAAVTAIAVSAGPAMAHGYNGNTMFVPASHSYSGSASLVSGGQKYPYGSFLVITAASWRLYQNHYMVRTAP
jgi:hypothetical protein